MLPALSGMIAGVALLALIVQRVNFSAEAQLGFVEAAATGVLLLAALELIPGTLSDLVFISTQLAVTHLTPAASSPAIPWTLLVPGAVQTGAIVLILVLYLRGNAIKLPEEAALLARESHAGWRARWQQWVALPPAGALDWAGLALSGLGLLCYNLWLGSQANLQTLVWPAVVLFALLGTAVGFALLGYFPEQRTRFAWGIPLAALLGLAKLAGAWQQAFWLQFAPAIMLLGMVCLVYAIGRMLRIVQLEIGLGWSTTLTVGVGALLPYLANLLVDQLG